MSVITISAESETTTRLIISFFDEGIPLIGQTVIDGDEAAAVEYAPQFEEDMRNNNMEV